MTNQDAIKILKPLFEQCKGKNGCLGYIEHFFTKNEEEALDLAIKALEQRWIPVSEGLPEERDWYLAVFKESDTEFQLIPRVADYIGMGENNWQLMDEDILPLEYRSLLECIAWMPLPEPYETESGCEK